MEQTLKVFFGSFHGGIAMDLLRLVEEDEIITVENGKHALLNWRGIHLIPEPTLDEELKRDPFLTWLNRRNRARLLKRLGKIEEAEAVRQEANLIAKRFGYKQTKK